jgi:hypothetical protein
MGSRWRVEKVGYDVVLKMLQIALKMEPNSQIYQQAVIFIISP